MVTGFDAAQLAKIHAHIGESNWVPFDRKHPPAYLADWNLKAADRLDRVIEDLTRSVVLEIESAELVFSRHFATGCTLRFPRVERVRFDKSWEDCDTVQSVVGIFKAPRSAAHPATSGAVFSLFLGDTPRSSLRSRLRRRVGSRLVFRNPDRSPTRAGRGQEVWRCERRHKGTSVPLSRRSRRKKKKMQ